MNYIVFDLELNSKPFKNRHPNEIIEIGAVKLDDKLKAVSKFQSFVRPRIYKKLFSVVRRKTNIKQSDIDNALEFKKALTQFREWMGDDYILCSWGHDDIHHFKTNCKFYHVGTKWLTRNVDIQKQFSKIYGLPIGQVSSLKNALELLDIPVDKELHRADADALYTAAVFKKVFGWLELDKQTEQENGDKE